jgi:ferredoxin
MGKYEDLLFAIPKEFHSWYGFATPRGFFRGTTMRPGWQFNMDFTSIIKPLPMEYEHTHHAKDEYLLFHNADLNNFFDFDAEIDVWLGEDPDHLELFTLTESTIIRVPPKLYHCPINFRRIGNPVMFSAVYLDGDWSKINRRITESGDEEFWYDGAGIRRCVYDRSKNCIYCGKCFSERMVEAINKPKPEDAPQDEYLNRYYEMAKLPRTGKYDKYVYAYKPEYHDDPRFLSPRAGFRGTEEMEDAHLRYLYDIVQKECEVGDEPHMHHAVEEYLVFTGSDITNFFDFDAEAEILIGDSRDTMEAYKVTEPTVVRIPPGYWHGPVTFKRVGSPVNFIPFYPSGEYGRVVFRDGVYQYEGSDLADVKREV